jgi:predicted SAM-dependent methyltransferase/transposase
VPDSRLLIKTLSGLTDPAEQQSLRDQFTCRGIAEQRLLIQVAVDSFEKHLESYRDVDIALDSYPYHGTTTTCEALWMGVPVVTLSGDRHASRVGVSILSNAGLPELVGENTEQFVEIARRLACDFERLAVLRGGMRERLSSSVLFNANAMGQNLGQAFREMWEHYCSAQALDLADALPEDSKLPARLRIGGQGRVDGWCLFDAIPCADVDFDGDMRNLSRFSNETYSEIYCSHHLQHLGLTEILNWLKEVRRIMQPGGKLYISVPDMDVLAWLYANPRVEKMDKFQLMRVLFGGQTNEFDFNLMGFSLDFMVDYLAQAGFASVEQVPSFGLFNDPSDMMIDGIPISLNLVVEVPSPE